MSKFNLLEYIQTHIPKKIAKEYTLTGKRIQAKNLKADQFVLGCIVKNSKTATVHVKSFGLQILGFVDSYELDDEVHKKVCNRFQYFEKELVEEPGYLTVRAYLKDYDFSGLSDEGFENAVYQRPILYAKRIGLGKTKAAQKPYVLLEASEDEKFEWRSNGLIVWFELQRKETS